MGQNDLNYLRKIHEASDLEGLGSLSHKFSSSTNGSKAKPQQPQAQPPKNSEDQGFLGLLTMSDDTERRVEKWEMGRMENVDMSALEGLTFELPDGTVIITAAADEPTDGLDEVQVFSVHFFIHTYL